MTWAEIDAALRVVEAQNRGIQITRVYCEQDGAPDTYYGNYSDGIVERGEAGYMISTGKRFKL